ncbi:MAG: MiaB/RimO family radical SAM methylthiotransferase [Acidimicrobiales bacterium]
MAERYWLETLGCPKNQVDSDKLAGVLAAEGMVPADGPGDADLVVVNTCAFIEPARRESIDTILALDDERRTGSRLVVTGCMAERYGADLAAALPEVDLVAPFGASLLAAPDGSSSVATAGGPDAVPAVPVNLSARRSNARRRDRARIDLLELPRPAATAPWAYLKVAEGCDRACGFCAIPSFRGRQRSRSIESILAEVDALGAREIVLVAQDLASYGRDEGRPGDIHRLVDLVAERVDRVRLLYLYPSELTDRLVDTIGRTGVAYFDLSLQHVSRPLLRRMKRWGDGSRFTERIAAIRAQYPEAALRSSFIVGYPGETEEDHDALLAFLEENQLDWAGFFAYSAEEGTYAAGLDLAVQDGLVSERMAELAELQDRITHERRRRLIGQRIEVLVDAPGQGRSHREAPEIDGIIEVPDAAVVGSMGTYVVTGAGGPDLEAVPVLVGADPSDLATVTG